MIYVYVFSGESLRRILKAFTKFDPTLKPGHERRKRVPIAGKFPLLLTNNSIRAEATPILFECHTFLLEMPPGKANSAFQNVEYTYTGVEPHLLYEPLKVLAPHGRLITRLELGNAIDVSGISWNEATAPDLPLLCSCFPNLQLLRLVVELKRIGHSAPDPIKPVPWHQLLARLETLHFVILHYGDEGIFFREAIAPGSRWVQDTAAVELGGFSLMSSWTMQKSVWSLQRPLTPMDDA